MPMAYPLPLAHRPGAVRRRGARRRSPTLIDTQVGADNVAAVIIEPIQGEGGFIVPAPTASCPGWPSSAASNGIVFIADEIQTGFCRTGDWFACEHEGVVPDLITTAKGIAGGLPLAAVTGRAEIMDAVHAGGLGGTYGGNPVACAAALGAIETMEERGPGRRAPAGSRRSCCRGCARWPGRCPAVGDVRGRGAMIAIELVAAGHDHSRPGGHRGGRGGLPPGRAWWC